MRVAIQDSIGVPYSRQDVTLSSDRYVRMIVNGKEYTTDKSKPLTVKTNRTGVLTIATRCYQAIGTPHFSLFVPGMDPQDIIDINPAGEVLSTFQSLTSAQLTNAKDKTNQEPVFPDSVREDPSQITSYLNDMSSLHLDEKPEVHGRYLVKTNEEVAKVRKKDGVSRYRFQSAALKKIPSVIVTPAATNPIQFVDSGSAKKVSKEMLVGGSLFDIDWGDLWEGIKRGFNQVVKLVADAIENAITVTVEFIVNGAKYIWNGIVQFAEEVLDLIQSIFNAIKVGFQKVFNWLASLFNWDEIKHTQTMIKEKFTESLNRAKSYFTTYLPAVTEEVTKKSKENVSQLMDQAAQYFGGKTFGDVNSSIHANLLSNATNQEDESGNYFFDKVAIYRRLTFSCWNPTNQPLVR